MQDPTPHSIFTAVELLIPQRPARDRMLDNNRSHLMAQAKVDVESPNALFIDKGKTLLCSLDHVLSSLISPVAPNLMDFVGWRKHRKELGRILEQFLVPAADLPSLAWVHCLCVTDKCLVRADYSLDTVLTRNDLKEYSEPGARIRLRFDYRPKNHVCINTDRISWVFPPGISANHPRFVKYIEDADIVRGRDLYSATHRERLGPAAISAEHERWLRRGLHPSLDGKTYELWRGPQSTELLKRSSGNSDGADELTLVDRSGVLDVQILKVQRVYEGAITAGLRDLLLDEIAIYFDRQTSRVISIGVLHDLFGYQFGYPDAARFAQSMLGQWLIRHSRN